MDTEIKVPADEDLPVKNIGGPNDDEYQPKPKRPYDKILTDLSVEDLQSPGVYKLILAKSSELEYENYELKKNDTKYRELEVKHASLSTELDHLKTAKKSIEFLFSVCLGSGTCLLGLSVSIYSTNSPLGGFLIAGLGLALAAVSIAVTFMDKK